MKTNEAKWFNNNFSFHAPPCHTFQTEQHSYSSMHFTQQCSHPFMNEHREMSPVSNPHSTEYQSKLTRDHGAKVFADKKSIAQSQHHLIAPQEAIHSHLHENLLTMSLLKLQVTDVPGYDLDEEDVVELFARYGRVTKVVIKENKIAYILYNDMMSALYAQKSLNGHYLKDINIRLFVNWCNPLEEKSLTKDEIKLLQINNQKNFVEILNTWNKETDITPKNPKPLPNLPLNISAFPYVPVKFTAKYEIQIPYDSPFQIGKKIIGPMGYNMKRIIIYCQKQVKNCKQVNKSEFLKLRLRGKGSGFKEGPEGKESLEPMHLCVSSKYIEVYKMACGKIEELLNKLYLEYANFCKKMGTDILPLYIKRIDDDENLKVVKTEEN